ncbi:nucleoside 2-deoxyribosyltransferase [Microbulbifer sediminum]|uniref:nucleoside 2-deoxyribosyltransferase n=1 Tax=Microbulbifer sediminum TaxID=2904250 RepID=UPI001F297642|nr:nucleoside 2-deoxyribosyltransferase [Microbulbifer sediminum]
MSEKDPCVICTTKFVETIPPTGDHVHQKCPRCGEFKVTGSALAMMGAGLGVEKRAKLSGWVFSQWRAGAIPMITTSNLNQILTRSIPSVEERAIQLLVEGSRDLKHLGAHFNVLEPRFLAATYSATREDVIFLLKVLEQQYLVNSVTMDGECEITPPGYMKLDELRVPESTSSQGFVAMWFSDDLNTAYSDGFEPGVFGAGYDPLRIDKAEHINRIDDEIIRQIKASRFVVADFTGHRGGVYFEAGFALGLGLPVFWTCRQDHMEELHFDIRQFNCIFWQSSDELAERLAIRLEAVLGPGPNKS